MKVHVLGLLLCITTAVNGQHGVTFNGNRCFVGGYQYFPNIGFYKMYTTPMSWGDAWKQCMDDGAHLVIINSQEEYDIIKTMLESAKGNYVYVGIHDLFKEGLFVTLKGENFVPTEYFKWNQGEPNNAGNENCVGLLQNGLLNDFSCARVNYFVCEHNQDPSYPLIPK